MSPRVEGHPQRYPRVPCHRLKAYILNSASARRAIQQTASIQNLLQEQGIRLVDDDGVCLAAGTNTCTSAAISPWRNRDVGEESSRLARGRPPALQ